MKWRQVEPGRFKEVSTGPGAYMQVVWRGKRWQVQRCAWIPDAPVFMTPLHVGRADTLAEAKALAERHGRAE